MLGREQCLERHAGGVGEDLVGGRGRTVLSGLVRDQPDGYSLDLPETVLLEDVDARGDRGAAARRGIRGAERGRV